MGGPAALLAGGAVGRSAAGTPAVEARSATAIRLVRDTLVITRLLFAGFKADTATWSRSFEGSWVAPIPGNGSRFSDIPRRKLSAAPYLGCRWARRAGLISEERMAGSES